MSKFPRLVVTGTHSSGKNYTSRILYELGFRIFLQEPLSPLSPPGIWLGKKSCLYTYCDTQSPESKQALLKRKLFQPTGNRQDLSPALFFDHSIWGLSVQRGVWARDGRPPWTCMGSRIKPYMTTGCFDVHDDSDLDKIAEWVTRHRIPRPECFR
jgi:hypothetical protein